METGRVEASTKQEAKEQRALETVRRSTGKTGRRRSTYRGKQVHKENEKVVGGIKNV